MRTISFNVDSNSGKFISLICSNPSWNVDVCILPFFHVVLKYSTNINFVVGFTSIQALNDKYQNDILITGLSGFQIS